MSNKFNTLMDFCGRINPDSLTSKDPDRRRSVVEYGIKLSPDWRGKKVLILGAGDGYEVQQAIGLLGWEAYGLTYLRKEMDGSADITGIGKRMTLGDMHDMPYPDAHFDCIYSKETLEHSPCPYLALVETARVLRPGGAFFHLIADGWNKQRDWYHFSCLPDWLWCDLFRKAGMSVAETVGYPDVERCAFENKAYYGTKVNERRLTDNAEAYKAALGFGGWVKGGD